MQLDVYVAQVQDQLVAAAALGDDRVREVAATLARAAAPAVSLAVLSVLAAAADEITAALLDSPGSPTVAVRLDSDEIRVAVTPGAAEAQPPQLPRPDDGDASARISLRLTEALKAEVDTAATAAGVSVNTWLVQAASAALGGKASNAAGHSGAREYRTSSSHHVTGWVTG